MTIPGDSRSDIIVKGTAPCRYSSLCSDSHLQETILIGGELLTTMLQTRESLPSHAPRRDPEKRPRSRSNHDLLKKETRRALLLPSIAAVLATLSVTAKSQSLSYSESSPDQGQGQ